MAAAAGVLSHCNRRDDSAPPAVRAGWALFDTRVALGHLANTAAVAVSKTSNGRDVRVSIRRLAPPPASSCVQLYTDDKLSQQPMIVAADGVFLLIHMVIAVEGRPTYYFPHNFFVYKADPQSPSMRSVPLPPDDWNARAKHTGIACKGKEFIVANLKTCNVAVDDITMKEVEVATVWLFSSATEQWETKQLDMPYDPEEGIVEPLWSTDTVFSFRGFICWVDYHRGILYCNVFSPEYELDFLRFPGIEMWRDDRGCPNMYRAVSMCRGHLKFVDIDNGQFRSTGSDDDYRFDSLSDDEEHSGNNGYDGCTIKTWTLRVPEFEWEEDTTLLLQDLSSLPSYQDSPLPRTLPMCPIIDMQEDNILHFILNGPGFLDKSWMVTVDMKNKLLGQHALYENPIEAEDPSFNLSNVFLPIPFVSTQLYH